MTRYSQILFCRFFAPWSDSGIDALKPDEHLVAAGPRRLLDEARNPVAERIDLKDELDRNALVLAEVDQPVEDRLPVAVAGEIVVGDEIVVDALGVIGAHDRLDVVGGAVARLAALDVDDGAEAALERTAAAGVEAGVMADDPPDHFLRQHGNRRRLHAGHVMQVIVEGLRLAGVDVAEKAGHPSLALAGEQGDAERLRLLEVRGQLRQHRYAAGDMEPADDDRNIELAERAREIERAGKLVRLDPDEPDESAAVGLDALRHRLDVDDLVALVIGFELDVDVGAERLFLGASGQKPVDAGEAVRRDGGEPPLDHVAVVVIVRRLDENDPERPLSHVPPCAGARRPPIGSAPDARTKNNARLLPALGPFADILPHLTGRSRRNPKPRTAAFARRRSRAATSVRDTVGSKKVNGNPNSGRSYPRPTRLNQLAVA